MGRPASAILAAAAAAVFGAAPAPAGVPAPTTFPLVAQKLSVQLPGGRGKVMLADRAIRSLRFLGGP